MIKAKLWGLRVGDRVVYHHRYRPSQGRVIKVNPKSVLVQPNHGDLVQPNYGEKVIRVELWRIYPRTHVLIRTEEAIHTTSYKDRSTRDRVSFSRPGVDLSLTLITPPYTQPSVGDDYPTYCTYVVGRIVDLSNYDSQYTIGDYIVVDRGVLDAQEADREQLVEEKPQPITIKRKRKPGVLAGLLTKGEMWGL